MQFGPTWHHDTTLPPVISAKQCQRISDLVGATASEGAAIRLGGKAHVLSGGHFFGATILDHVRDTIAGYTKEFFGAVLAVQRFTTVEQAFSLADHPEYGLRAASKLARYG